MLFLIRAAALALYPRTDELPGVIDTDVDTFLRRFKREANGIMWAGVVLGALIFTLTPLLTVYLPLPSFLLTARTLDKHADRIANFPIYLVRQAVIPLKLVAGLCWASHPTVRAKFALPPYPAEPSVWRSGDARAASERAT